MLFVVSFGRNLRKFREDADLTQTELGEHIAVDQSQISKWEKNHGEPTLSQLIALAIELGHAVDEFLVGVDDRYEAIRKAAAVERPTAPAPLPRHGDQLFLRRISALATKLEREDKRTLLQVGRTIASARRRRDRDAGNKNS